MQEITLPQLAWHGVKKLRLSLPESWQVDVCNMAGYNRPRLTLAGIKKAISGLIGMAPLREYARGKKEVVIIFDDMARVTRAAEIVPFILAELSAAGIEDSQIRFIAACGTHGAMDRADFAKKLGEDIPARFPVYNHNPFHNGVYAGTTSRGTRVCINAEVMKCDLKIGIGSILPHIMAGFGGGGKIILPGVAAYETIAALHAPPESAHGGAFADTVMGMGVFENNPRRRDIDEVSSIVGLDMKIDAVVNMWGETVAVFPGAPGPAYAAALAEAKKHYLTPLAGDSDIVIANSFAKASESVSGLLIAFPSVKKAGGDIVLIANAPEGQVTHYLMGSFGNTTGGQLHLRMKPPPQVNRIIIFSEYPEQTFKNFLEDSDKVILVDNWEKVMKLLQASHGHGARAAVYPNADIQYYTG
jgi:nickel-dependent lactate racemase